MALPDLSALSRIHELMGIKTPFQGMLESARGVPVKRDGSNTLFRDGAIYIIDPETGKEHQATIHIKNQQHLLKKTFPERFDHPSWGWKSSKRIHLFKCSTINDMIEKKEYWKYHSACRSDHKRLVEALDGEDEVDLRVCKNCIKQLEPKQKAQVSNISPNKFDFEKFFTLGIGGTPETEKNEADPADCYPDDWDSINKEYKKSVNWICECCSVNLFESQNLLHTHHKNKRKADNSPANLQALCSLCHSKQPAHEHMKGGVSKNIPFLEDLRKNQGGQESCRNCDA